MERLPRVKPHFYCDHKIDLKSQKNAALGMISPRITNSNIIKLIPLSNYNYFVTKIMRVGCVRLFPPYFRVVPVAYYCINNMNFENRSTY